MEEKKYKIFRSIWFWWILTTCIYIALTAPTGNVGSLHPTLIGYVTGFVGLFVPYGIISLILLSSSFGWVSVVVFIALMVFSTRKLDKKELSLGKRILFNLLALLIITTIVDLVRGTPFASWFIFFSGSFN